MPSNQKHRRLAAVMFTDIVGYTAMMQADEAAANAIRVRHRTVFEKNHEQFHGEILQLFGKSTLIFFQFAVEAVECTISIRRYGLVENDSPQSNFNFFSKKSIMKYINTLLFATLVFALGAQPTINFDLHQSIGQEWGGGIVENFTFDSLPFPLQGENLTWDFTFLGELDNGYGVTFNEAEIEDFRRAVFDDIDGLTLSSGGFVIDSFPTAIGAIFLGDNPNNYDDISLWSQNEFGIERLGEIRDEGGPPYDIDDKNTFLIYPTELNYGESLTRFKQGWGNGFSSTHGVTIDSFFTADTFAYIGFGTLEMYYGEVEDVVLYQHKRKYFYRTYSAATGQLLYEGDDYSVSYLFQQNGNFLSLIFVQYNADADWTPSNLKADIGVYVPYLPIVNHSKETTRRTIHFSLSPNPASDRVLINYILEKTSEVRLSLYDSEGRIIKNKEVGVQIEGAYNEELLLPGNLPSGNYFLKLNAGDKSGVQKILIQ